jgi:hypothetical protein
VNNSLWDGLINATNNRSLSALLTALKSTSSGGLTVCVNPRRDPWQQKR